MLGDSRRLGKYGDIGIAEFEAGRAHVRRYLTQEHSAVGAAVARIAVRKMLTDIAHPERAQHGVAKRVNHDVAVGMRDDPLRVVDSYAAQDDVVARAERMDIEPLADS